eukprot:633096_1
MTWHSTFLYGHSRFWNFLAVSTFGVLRSAVGFGPSIPDRKSNQMIIESNGTTFASVSLKGKSTPYQFKPFNQDSYFYRIMDNFRLLGVCDGHGPKGHNVSHHIAERISAYVEQTQDDALEPNARLSDIVTHAVNEIENRSDIETKRSGSTLVFSYIDNDILYTANVGDSRAIVCYRNPSFDWILSTKQLNVEHTHKVKQEVQRVYANGGYVDGRGYVSHSNTPYGINMTRSLGDDDIHHNNIVSSEPDIMQYQISPTDVCVVHGTDGIWDVMDNMEVAGIINNCLPDLQQAAIDIVQECEKRWRQYAGRVDDITITIFALKEDMLTVS